MGPNDDDQAKLELRWPHKHGRLLYEHTDKGAVPRFVEGCLVEPRILVDVAQRGTELGKDWDEESNLLIKGDNLVALETLAKYYKGKVKLVYIDPPFNTQQAFDDYEDGLEHSIWLTMMRDRLELLRDLLSTDGSLWCEIDDSEVGYLNVLLDEVFGRPNRIATVTIKRSAGTGHKAINPGPVNVTDFLFAYAKDRPKWKYIPQLVLRDDYDKQYSKWIPNVTEPAHNWRFENLPDVFARHKGFADAKAGRRMMSAAVFMKEMQQFALWNALQVVRFALPNYSGVSKAAQELIDVSRKDKTRVFKLEREEHSIMYFYGGDRILFLSDKVQLNGGDEDEVPSIAERLTNFWDDIPWQGIAKEGGVKFPKNKKPERLIQRVIASASDRGDLVLDSFAGSGTTGAVAHKMRRRWIMVELGDHAESHAMKRLSDVVAGTDLSGVTKSEAWLGGGGFRFMTIGEPLYSLDPDLDLFVLNPKYTNGPLVTAVCLREGFRPTGDKTLHGQAGGTTFAHVTEQYLTADYLEAIQMLVPEGAALTVFCLHHAANLGRRDRVTIRRISTELRSRYCTVELNSGSSDLGHDASDWALHSE